MRGLLGMIHRRRGELVPAEAQLRRAAAKAQAAADPLMEAQMLAHLGQLYADDGHAEARQTLERALLLGTVHHYDFGRAVALHGLGLLEIAEDRPQEAAGRLRAAMEIWDGLQNTLGRARTLAALGEAHAKGATGPPRAPRWRRPGASIAGSATTGRRTGSAPCSPPDRRPCRPYRAGTVLNEPFGWIYGLPHVDSPMGRRDRGRGPGLRPRQRVRPPDRLRPGP
nr:hypothetical protein GCM10020093_001120 [Planobispora longispora]